MAKSKTTAVAVIEPQADNVVGFAKTDDVVGFAAALGVSFTGTLDDRADLAAEHMNRSQRYMLAAGLLLASIKAEAAHGEFTRLTEERGFEERAAQRAMQYALFIVSRSPDERARLIELPKSKVLALAGADQEVIDHLLSDGEASIDALSVRALQDRIRELEAIAVDTGVQLETTEAKLTAAEKKLAKAPADREDHVPLVVAELRAEIAALIKKAELAVDSFNPLGAELMTLVGTDAAHAWADATIRLAVAGLASVQLQVAGVLKKFRSAVPDAGITTDQSHLSLQEVVETAERWTVLTRAHEHEKALREWEAEQKAPKGKGRPRAKPEAPKGGK